jgi:hypothetical protein
MLWTDGGNNADSSIGLEDGVLIAQNDKSQILKVGLNGVVTLSRWAASTTSTPRGVVTGPHTVVPCSLRIPQRRLMSGAPRTAVSVGECSRASCLLDVRAIDVPRTSEGTTAPTRGCDPTRF